MRSSNLNRLVDGLVSRGTRDALAQPPPNETEGAITTTIRLAPHARHFWESQAQGLGVSLQVAITMGLTGIMEATMHPGTTTATLIRDHFFHLFEAHGIALPTIPAILKPYGVTLSALADEVRLLDLITDPVIAALSRTCAVNADWLRGTSEFPTKRAGFWYKHQDEFCEHLTDLRKEGKVARVLFLKARGNLEDAYHSQDKEGIPAQDVGIVIEVDHTTADGVTYSTYEWWDSERWNYWRTRLHLKTIMLFCARARAQHELEYGGRVIKDDLLDGIGAGRILVADALRRSPLGGSAWYPEDYISSEAESVKAAETDELDDVIEEYNRLKLDKYLAPPYWSTPSGAQEP